MLLALLLAGTAALPAATASADPREIRMLERHRPVLRYDREERHFAVSVDALTKTSRLERDRGRPTRIRSARFLGRRYADDRQAEPTDRLVPFRAATAGRPRVYGRAARDRGGGLWLQYWLFFAENTQDRGVVRTGRHTGDWELVQIRLSRTGRPVEATLAQHTWAEGCAWSELERAGAAPVVYVANGSHALYPRPGTADRPFPDPNDEADGRGRRARPPLRVATGTSPRWMGWPGRWGDDEAGLVPAEHSSPRGPAFQPERWDDPSRFHAEEARPCGAGPPGRPWQTALTILLAFAVLAALLRAGVRSYNRER